MPSPSTKPMKSSCERVHGPEQFRVAPRTSFDALYFLDADIQQTDRRPFEIEQYPRHRAAHDRQRGEMAGIAAD